LRISYCRKGARLSVVKGPLSETVVAVKVRIKRVRQTLRLEKELAVNTYQVARVVVAAPSVPDCREKISRNLWVLTC
jgi:hypothetical protein